MWVSTNFCVQFAKNFSKSSLMTTFLSIETRWAIGIIEFLLRSSQTILHVFGSHIPRPNKCPWHANTKWLISWNHKSDRRAKQQSTIQNSRNVSHRSHWWLQQFFNIVIRYKIKFWEAPRVHCEESFKWTTDRLVEINRSRSIELSAFVIDAALSSLAFSLTQFRSATKLAT